eukprot:COSAG01_NODE_1169_length_11408_cov_35.108056_3_plen_2198_part_00
MLSSLLPLEATELLAASARAGRLSADQHDTALQALSAAVLARDEADTQVHGARRLQEVIPFADSSLKTGWTNILGNAAQRQFPLADPRGGLYTQGPGGPTCTDPMSTGGAGGSSCTYSCTALKTHYFGAGAASDAKTKCYRYVAASGKWLDDAGGDLMAQKQMKTIYGTIMAPAHVNDSSIAASMQFVVGKGKACTNVTGNFSSGAQERTCKVDGVHQTSYTHTRLDGATQYTATQNGIYKQGKCTDVMIQVSATKIGASQLLKWKVTDGGKMDGSAHSSPQFHNCTGSACLRTHRHYMCLYDNTFTFERVGSSDWSGTVAVYTWVPDNTITIPTDERWIIQGQSVNGLPVEMDARLASGNPFALSNASIVIRHVRFSGQPGTLDPYQTNGGQDAFRAFSHRPHARMGGAFYYEGGLGSTLTFDHVMYDHCGAISGSGGAVMIAGRAERNSPEMCAHGLNASEIQARKDRLPGYETAYPPTTAGGCGMTLNFLSSVFWANTAFVAGAFRGVNIHPISFASRDNVWVDNDAVVGHDGGIWRYNTMTEIFGSCSYLVENDISLKGDCMAANRKNPYTNSLWCKAGLGAALNFYSFPGSSGHPTLPAQFTATFRNYDISGNRIWYHPLGIVVPQKGDSPSPRLSWDSVNMHDTQGSQVTSVLQSSLFVGTGDGFSIPLARTNFNHSKFADNSITRGVTESDSISSGGHIHLLCSGTISVHFSEFRGGRARDGGAIYVRGDGDLAVRSSLFEGNTALTGGGAIYHNGAGKLMVQDTVFNQNAVVVPSGTSGSGPQQGVVLRLNTGSLGVVEGVDTFAPGYTGDFQGVPLFKIDGPEPLVGCRGACTKTPLEVSRDHASVCPEYSWAVNCVDDKGVKRKDGDPAWDNETIYGSNRSSSTPFYNQFSTYAEVVNLSPGKHTLWYGLRSELATQFQGWVGGGWIDIVGIMPKLYPKLFDNRAQPDDGNSAGYQNPAYSSYSVMPGCWNAAPNSATHSLCPKGFSFWGHVDFTVPYGSGGAINFAGANSLQLNNITFTNNSAGEGAAINAVGASDVTIAESHFVGSTDGSSHLASTVAEATCHTGTCPVGHSCTFATHSIACKRCLRNEVGDGNVCQVCPAGMSPDVNQSKCEICPVGTASDFGICEPCGEKSFAAVPGTKICQPCETMTKANTDRSACVCDTGSYNGTSRLVVCFNGGYDDELVSREQAARGNARCDTCPKDVTGEGCMSCKDGNISVQAGFVAPAVSATSQDDIKFVFRCHHDMEVAVKRCPGGGAFRRLQVRKSTCAPGYNGHLCGECEENFGMTKDRECVACDDTDTGAAFGIFFAAVVVLIIVLTIFGKLWSKFPLKYLLRCSIQPIRIVITYAQVTTQLGDVLDFSYPGVFGDVIEFLKPIMDVFGLLFRAMGPSECFGIQGFTSRWLLRVVGLPAVMSVLVLLVYVFERFVNKSKDAALNAKGYAMFTVFFCYPTICVISFASFICKKMSPDDSVLELDDGVICEDPDHRVLQGLSVAVIVVIAVGIPTMLLIYLLNTTAKYNQDLKTKNAAIAKRMSIELDVDTETAEYVIRDVTIGRSLSFVMDAYQPQYLFWEVVDMFRKLALVGIVLIVRRGSIAQLAAAILLAFVFFALHIKTWPYKQKDDNMFRAATELHVFIVILVALILQNDLRWELLTVDAYDYILFLSFFLLVPGAFLLTVYRKIRYVNSRVNKMAGVDARERRRRAFDLQALGLGDDADRANLLRYIEGWSIHGKYAAFLSHYKTQAAAEARILKLELQRGLRLKEHEVFLDADNLSDLRDLLAEVRSSDVLVLMLTDGVLSRPWCLAELHEAAESKIPIVILQINNAFKCSRDQVEPALQDLPAFLQKKNPGAIEQLKAMQLDPTVVGPKILAAVANDSALSFDPNQSAVMLRSQVEQLAQTMVKLATPENEQLLSFLDLSKLEPDPWQVTRSLAVYIVFAEGSGDEMATVAGEMKAWLTNRAGLDSKQIALCNQPPNGGGQTKSHSQDCNILRDTDMVLMLQTQQLIEEPRCLARLYLASRFGVPIVPVCLQGLDARRQYDFDTVKNQLEGLASGMDPASADSLVTATGAQLVDVSQELARSIPNLISKPLSIVHSPSEFEAQMMDIELTLRRSLSLKGNAQISTTPEPTTAASTGFDTAQRTRQGVAGSSPVRVKVRYRATTPEPGAVKSSDTRAGTPPLRVNV